MEHLDLRRRGPKGDKDAEWECIDCGKKGKLNELYKDHSCAGPKKDQDTRLINAIEGRE